MPSPTVAQRIYFNAQLIAEDMTEKGWNQLELSRKAGVSNQTVMRFLRNEGQTPKVAKKIARALGKPIRRYMISSQQVA